MEIEIFSDVVCPWCYLGKARLETALESFDGEVNLRWRAYQLDPAAPRSGQPLLPWLGAKFSGEQRARQAMAHVTGLAEAEGLRLDFDRALIANSFDAHRLLWFADQPQTVVFGATADTQPTLAGVLHRAHFTEGSDIASHDVLADLAESVGLDRDRVCDYLASTEGVADVRADVARAHDLGITSVPTFIFAGTYSVSGAQTSELFGSVLREVALREVARREGLADLDSPPIPGQRTASTKDATPL